MRDMYAPEAWISVSWRSLRHETRQFDLPAPPLFPLANDASPVSNTISETSMMRSAETNPSHSSAE